MELIIGNLQAIGLKTNADKTKTNSNDSEIEFPTLESGTTYKYLGVLENNNNMIAPENKEKILKEIYNRVELLCKTKLNAKNMFRAINEYALSLLDYYIGILDFKPKEMERIDIEIRRILNSYKIHLKPANKERLYLPRSEFGRGLISIEYKAEKILHSFYSYLKEENNDRKRTILENEKTENSMITNIEAIIKGKYQVQNDTILSSKIISSLQKETAIATIKGKIIHKTFYEATENSIIDKESSSSWLKRGETSPKDEGFYLFIQDRNVFFGPENNKKCPHCNQAKKTVDHLATNCGRLLPYDYLQRHNEVLKCIHLSLCRKYKFTENKKLKVHQITKKLENDYASIVTDHPILTDIRVKENRPDIVVYDKFRKVITIIEVGITSASNLQHAELTKKRKYDLLAKELGQLERMKVQVIPYVLTWDGLVTTFNKTYRDDIGLDEKTHSYIQTVALKKTLETVSFEHRELSQRNSLEEEESTQAIDRLYEQWIQHMPTCTYHQLEVEDNG